MGQSSDVSSQCRPPGDPSDLPIVFISGMGRSGSTLLGRALGEIPRWWSLGEVVNLWTRGVAANERCACGERFHECPIWTAIGSEAYGGWKNLDLEHILDLQRSVDRDRHIISNLSPYRRKQYGSRFEEYADVLLRLYRAARLVTDSDVLVDSSKHVSTAVMLRNIAAIDLRIVHLIRDSRGVAYSWTKRVARPETDNTDLMTQWSPAHTSTRYVAYNYILQGMSLSHTPVHRLRYEDFVEDPRRAIGDIVDFAGRAVKDLPFIQRRAIDLRPSHNIGGNPGRFEADRVELKHDEAWRVGLSSQHRRIVTSLTWPLLVQHGYNAPATVIDNARAG